MTRTTYHEPSEPEGNPGMPSADLQQAYPTWLGNVVFDTMPIGARPAKLE